MKKQIPVKVIAFVMLSSLITGSVALASPSGAPPSPNLPNATFNSVEAKGGMTGGDDVAGTGVGISGNSKSGIGVRGIASGQYAAVIGVNNSGPADTGIGVKGYTGSGNINSVGGEFSYDSALLNRVTLGTKTNSIDAFGPVSLKDTIRNDGLNYNGALKLDDTDGLAIDGPIHTATSAGLKIGAPVNLFYKILELGNYNASTKVWTPLVEFLTNGAWHSSNGSELKIQNDKGFQVGPYTPNAAGGPPSATFDPDFQVSGLGALSNPGSRNGGNLLINDRVTVTGIQVGSAPVTAGSTLNIKGTGNEAIRIEGTGATYGFLGKLNFGDGDYAYIQEDVDDHLLIAANGGTTVIGAFVASGTASKPGGGSWAVSSDIRLKDVKNQFERGLKAILNLNPIEYRYKKDNPKHLPSDTDYIGLSAQEVQKVIPEAISTDATGYLQLNNDPIIWTMLNAIKEISRTIDEVITGSAKLQVRVEKLEKENKILQLRLDKLEAKIQ